MTTDQASPDGVIQVVADISDDIRQADQLTLQSPRSRIDTLALQPPLTLGMTLNAVANFPGQVQTAPILLEDIHNPETLMHVMEPIREKAGQRSFTSMPKGRMAKVVPQGDSLGQVLIKTQGPSDGPGNLADFKGMG